MSINFSANQYEQAFHPRRMLNYELPKEKGKYPNRRDGFSTIHANDRGHLLPNVPRTRASPWGSFVGNWNMPCRLPGIRQLDPTSRSERAHLRLSDHVMDSVELMSGGLKKTRTFSPLPQRITMEEASAASAGFNMNDFNNAANPAMKAPAPRTQEFTALKRILTPPDLPMTHGVIHRYPSNVDQLILDPSCGGVGVVPRPLPSMEGRDIPAEMFDVQSPRPGEPSTMTGAVDSLQENYVEEP